MPFFLAFNFKNKPNYYSASEMLLTKYFKAMLKLIVLLVKDYSAVCVTHLPGQNRVNQVKGGQTQEGLG